jgi:hypothetical protein
MLGRALYNAMATDGLCARPALLPPGWLPARNFPDVVCQEKKNVNGAEQ